MILVDTSTWIDHFHHADPSLAAALTDGHVGLHPFVIGELILGRLPRRSHTLALLATLPGLVLSAHEDVVAFVDRYGLVGSGAGWVDVHLLCAVHAAGWQVWTHDRRVVAAAKRLG
jgi:predicted nucleic acid-binding protein